MSCFEILEHPGAKTLDFGNPSAASGGDLAAAPLWPLASAGLPKISPSVVRVWYVWDVRVMHVSLAILGVVVWGAGHAGWQARHLWFCAVCLPIGRVIGDHTAPFAPRVHARVVLNHCRFV